MGSASTLINIWHLCLIEMLEQSLNYYILLGKINILSL